MVMGFLVTLGGAFLNAPDQLLFLAFQKLQLVFSQFRKFLLKLAHHNVPVPLSLKCIHNWFFLNSNISDGSPFASHVPDEGRLDFPEKRGSSFKNTDSRA